MKVLGVIPARYKSSRFPGKPLVEIGGQSMITRVYHQAVKSQSLTAVVVATDDTKIYNHCINANLEVIMTHPDHKSGTDRVAEVAMSRDEDIVINIQGDEPFIPPGNIDRLCNLFRDPAVHIGTLYCPFYNRDKALLPQFVKVVCRDDGRALYFSRSFIPYQHGVDPSFRIYRHLGIYGYRKNTLLRLAALPQGELELSERLEQLRWLEAGYEIMTAEVSEAPHGVDIPADVAVLERWMISRGLS